MNYNWKAPEHWLKIKTLDAHTGGEPLRIILDGLPHIPGDSIRDKRRYFSENLDHIRTGLMWEPRGHADQYGAILTEPTTPDGDIGVFFLHNEGYSSMCGHAILALGKVLPEIGILQKSDDVSNYNFDTPAGRVVVSVKFKNGNAENISFKNVPSFVFMHDCGVEVPGFGDVVFDIAFGGAFYACCSATQLGLDLIPENANKLIALGRSIKNEVVKNFEIEHPEFDDLSFLYGTIFVGEAHNPLHHSRNVCIFADGELDRSPTGTGVSARSAIHYIRHQLKIGEEIIIESILGTTMSVKILKEQNYHDYYAVIPEVSGKAFIIGMNEFYFDPNDPLRKGFIFR